MVSKSFESFPQLCAPFEKNGKMYVKVQNPKTLTIREVRWYEPKGYKETRPLRDVLGFSKGYITVFCGDIENNEFFFNKSPCRFHNKFGWYLPSDIDFNFTLPQNVIAKQLLWENAKDKLQN